MAKLERYRQKRDFKVTGEPSGKKRAVRSKAPIFVIQDHHASHHHFDFRLEMGGVLKSWAVPKGVSTDPGEKRLAVHVEDHPLEYAKFQGTIPNGEYGAGTVKIFDIGTWESVTEREAGVDYQSGKLVFQLKGKKLRGTWTLVRMKGKNEDEGKNWLLIRKED